jgi:hypothetical protein
LVTGSRRNIGQQKTCALKPSSIPLNSDRAHGGTPARRSRVEPPNLAVMRASVTLHIDAPPKVVWALVSDITRMGDYSPEVVEAEWLGDSTGPAVGARFRGHVKRNENWPVLYWTTCEITGCVPGELFEFAVVMRERPVNTWRYEFLPTDDGGTDVTESFDLGDNIFTKIWRPIGGFLRERRNQRDMLRTLQRVKAAAESP